MVEERRHAEETVEPRELIVERDALTGLDALLDADTPPPGLGPLDGEPVHDHTVAVRRRAGRVFVAPGVVIACARREHLDVPAAAREPVRGLAHHRFGTAQRLGAVPRRNEREPARHQPDSCISVTPA